jgi:hypothetical protein
MRRSLFVAALLPVVAITSANTHAWADKHVFVISNDADGYGVDRCLANGDICGKAVATAYCKSREFRTAISYRKVDHDEITGTVPSSRACQFDHCGELIAIECDR